MPCYSTCNKTALTIPATVVQAAPPQAAIQLNALMLATDEAMLADPPCSNTDRMYAQMMIPHEQVGP
jgi:uncharacterized protein (DUF305 family)